MAVLGRLARGVHSLAAAAAASRADIIGTGLNPAAIEHADDPLGLFEISLPLVLGALLFVIERELVGDRSRQSRDSRFSLMPCRIGARNVSRQVLASRAAHRSRAPRHADRHKAQRGLSILIQRKGGAFDFWPAATAA